MATRTIVFGTMETPPDTLRIKDDLLKHRFAINELKQAYNVSAMDAAMDSPMETPIATAAGPRPGGVRFASMPEDTPVAETPAPPIKSNQALLHDVLLFPNPILSGIVLLTGTVLIAGVHYLLVASPLTFLSAFCYLLLGDVAINFVRSLVSRQWQEQGYWRDSNTARAVVARVAALADSACHAHDVFLSARDPVLTLKAALVLWALVVVGTYLSFWNVVTLVFVLAFTVPVGFQKYQPVLSGTMQKVGSLVKAKWAALGLTRKHKAALISVLLVMLWIRTSWPTRLVALLVGALAGRCQLKPAEVEYIMTQAEPYTQSVKKSARRLSLAATDFARRNMGTKTHFR